MPYFLLLALALPVGSSQVLTLPHASVFVVAVPPAYRDQAPDFVLDYVCRGRLVAIGLPVARPQLPPLLQQIGAACS